MTIWTQPAPGLFIGDLVRPYRDEFDYVLAISDEPLRTDNGLRHWRKQVPTTDIEIADLLSECSTWLCEHWQTGKRLLVQSADPRLAELIVASFFVHLGAGLDEAILSLRRAKPAALADEHYLNCLRNWRVDHA